MSSVLCRAVVRERTGCRISQRISAGIRVERRVPAQAVFDVEAGAGGCLVGKLFQSRDRVVRRVEISLERSVIGQRLLIVWSRVDAGEIEGDCASIRELLLFVRPEEKQAIPCYRPAQRSTELLLRGGGILIERVEFGEIAIAIDVKAGSMELVRP